ncbi:MAG: hypothetical protein HYZ34_06335 [Ignavibacteriae bacterium]|nr:hypothetical protein [Ignavibacteriota bacterium]
MLSDSLIQVLQSSLPTFGERLALFSITFFVLSILGMLVYFKMNDTDAK